MSEVKKSDAISNKEISLRDVILRTAKVWKFLKSRWLTIAAITALGLCIGVVYSMVQKPIYKAEVSFALEDDKSSAGISAAMGLASQFGLDLGTTGGGGAFAGDNLLNLMKSRSMVERTLLSPVKLNDRVETLAQLYISFNKIQEGWANNPQMKSIHFFPNADRANFSRQQDSVLGIFFRDIVKTNLFVDKVDKKLSIITVRVTSKNELFCKYFAEILVKNVSDFYVLTKTKKSAQNVNILQRQVDSVRRELNAAINGVAASADVNPNPNPSLQILRAPSQKRQIDVQANTAILTQLVANLELSKISLRKETPLVQIIDTPILPLEREKLGKIKGAIFGAGIAGFLVVFFLLTNKVINNILRD